MVPTYTRGSADDGPAGALEMVVTAGSRGGDLNASPFLFTFLGSGTGVGCVAPTLAVSSDETISPVLAR